MNKFILYGIIGIIVSYFVYPSVFQYTLTKRLLSGLKNQAQPDIPCSRVAIGYNANLDLIVNAIEVFSKLNIKPAGASSHTQIMSLSDLQETFSYFLRTGSAAERVVSTAELFQQITDAAASLENKQYHTGGNAALMANSLAERGCSVLLGGAVGSTLASLLHPDVVVIKDEDQPSTNDEVHLIMEYAKGASWGNLTSPRANRFIVTRDETNSKITTLELFHKSLAKFDPSYVIISGLHLLETLSVQERTARLDTMLTHLQDVALHTKSGNDRVMAHLELASIGSSDLLRDLSQRVLPRVDSLGLNEQELGGVYAVTGGTAYDVEAFKTPKVLPIVDAIKHVFALSVSNRFAESGRSLTRIHFHCLHFHIIAQKRNSMWEPGMQSVARGSLACSQQACDNDGVDLILHDNFPVSLNRNITLDYDHPVATWEDGELDFYLAPVLVCRKPTRTVGLGDAISAVGLMYHGRKRT